MRIRHDRPEVAERDVGQLRQEHRLVVADGTAHRPGGEGPQLGQAAQQGGLPGTRLAGDDHRLAGTQSQVQVVDQLLARGISHLDVVQFDRAVGVGLIVTIGSSRLCSLAVTSPYRRMMEAR